MTDQVSACDATIRETVEASALEERARIAAIAAWPEARGFQREAILLACGGLSDAAILFLLNAMAADEPIMLPPDDPSADDTFAAAVH